MARAVRIVAVLSVLAFASATGAHAQSAQDTKPNALAQAPASSSSVTWTKEQNRRPLLQWNGIGRWGLRLDMDQPVGRQENLRDVEAGAYYRLTPSLRVGGSVGLGEKKDDPARPAPEQKSQPRVRLETIFRF
jgi:hypothetical protein